MEIKEFDIDELVPYWRNPRINLDSAEIVKRSIEKYGYNSPIIIDKNKVIVTGHTRYRALKNLGYKSINCVVIDLPTEKANAYRIMDNKSGEFSRWDDLLLSIEIDGLKSDELVAEYFEKDEPEEIETGTEVRIDKVDEFVKGEFIELTCPECLEVFSALKKSIIMDLTNEELKRRML